MDIKEFNQLKNASLGHSLIKAGRLYNEYALSIVKQDINQPNLKPSHMQLFPHIPFEGITIVALAQKMEISKQAVSTLVNEMLDMKLLVKKPNPNDKRSFLISFKTTGKHSIFNAMQKLRTLDVELQKLLGKQNAQLVNESLIKIINSLEQQP